MITGPWKPFGGRPGLAFMLAAVLATPLRADLSRDSSTARIVGEEGNWIMENAVQLEKDKEGKTWTLETAVEYSLRAHVQLLLEPTLWERSEPRSGPTEDGIGDTDLTLAYLIVPDEGPWPAVIVAAKVKIPTAGNRAIGTGRPDYSASLILGKEIGELDVGLELEFATFGSPVREPAAPEPAPVGADEESDEGMPADQAAAGFEKVRLKGQFIYNLSADYGLTENLSAYVEIFGNTAPNRDEKASPAAGVGFEYDLQLTEYADPFLQAGVDTEHLVTAKIGVEWNW